jgi:hypothetical protein
MSGYVASGRLCAAIFSPLFESPFCGLKIDGLKPLGKSDIDLAHQIVLIPNAALSVVEAPETGGGS